MKKYFLVFLVCVIYICEEKFKNMAKTNTVSVVEQIKEALDGRPQRWLSLRAQIPESDLSKKMNGIVEFKEDEIVRINEALNCSIEFKVTKG